MLCLGLGRHLLDQYADVVRQPDALAISYGQPGKMQAETRGLRFGNACRTGQNVAAKRHHVWPGLTPNGHVHRMPMPPDCQKNLLASRLLQHCAQDGAGVRRWLAINPKDNIARPKR